MTDLFRAHVGYDLHRETPESVVARVFDRPVPEIDDKSSPDTIGAWDSLGHITLLIELEATYGISFSAEESLTMTNLVAIKRVLHERAVKW